MSTSTHTPQSQPESTEAWLLAIFALLIILAVVAIGLVIAVPTTITLIAAMTTVIGFAAAVAYLLARMIGPQ